MLEGWFMKNYTATDTRYATEKDVEVSDEELTKRLASLPTVIEMPYNPDSAQIISNDTLSAGVSRSPLSLA